MKVLLTGAAGQVGCEIAKLGDSAFKVHGFDRAALDVADPAQVAQRLDEVAPALVVNCAAYTAVDRAEDEPEAAHRANAEAPGVLGAACRARGIGVVHLSTDYVFDGAKPSAYHEEDLARPLGVYGATKLAGEEALRAANPRHIVLRVSWVFGRLGRSFVDTILRLARERPELAVVDDQVGAPSPAMTIAEAVRTIALAVAGREDAWGTYHFSTTPALSWCAFARAIVAAGTETGLLESAPAIRAITSDEWPAKAPRPRNSRLDACRLQAVFGIAPTPWQGALRDYIAALARPL